MNLAVNADSSAIATPTVQEVDVDGTGGSVELTYPDFLPRRTSRPQPRTPRAGPAWSTNGRWIAFVSDRDGSDDVFVMRPDGSGIENLTRTPELEESHPSWTPDGRLSFTRHGETGPIELWVVDADGSAAERLNTPGEPVFVYDWR